MYPGKPPDAATGTIFSRTADDFVFGSHNPSGGLIFNSRKSSMCGPLPKMDIMLYFILEGREK